MHRPASSPLLLDNPQAALEYELAHEKASALGRLGRALESALARLAEFDAVHREGTPTESTRGERRALVAVAGVALWHFVVQREAVGLRDGARVMQDYRVPAEVRARMGAFPAAPSQQQGDQHGP